MAVEETTVVGYKARRAGQNTHDVKGFTLLNGEFCVVLHLKWCRYLVRQDIILTCPSGYSAKIDFRAKGRGQGGYGRGTDVNGDVITLEIYSARSDLFRQIPTLIARKIDKNNDTDRENKIVAEDVQTPSIRITDTQSVGPPWKHSWNRDR